MRSLASEYLWLLLTDVGLGCCLAQFSLDARLICGVEDVIHPDVVIAIGVVILQVKSGVALGRVASDAIAGRAGWEMYPRHAVPVGRVAFELVRRGVEKLESIYPIVAGEVVQKSVVASDIQRKAVLVISRRRISPEQVFFRVIHNEAKKIAHRRYLFPFRKVNAVKLKASAEVRDNAGSFDIYVAYRNYPDAGRTIGSTGGTSDRVAV